MWLGEGGIEKGRLWLLGNAATFPGILLASAGSVPMMEEMDMLELGLRALKALGGARAGTEGGGGVGNGGRATLLFCATAGLCCGEAEGGGMWRLRKCRGPPER